MILLMYFVVQPKFHHQAKHLLVPTPGWFCHVSVNQELLVEQKFEDGMLAKMSKITDLIARLEGLSKSSPEDSARCTKCTAQFFVRSSSSTCLAIFRFCLPT